MKRVVTCSLFSLVVLLMFVGCGHHPEHPSDDQAAEPALEPAAEPHIEMTAALEAKLAAADHVDGEDDHVVSRCGGCGLAMEGSDDHVVQAGEYSLHFCSLRCKEDFSQDLEASLLALAIPGEEQAADEPEQERQ